MAWMPRQNDKSKFDKPARKVKITRLARQQAKTKSKTPKKITRRKAGDSTYFCFLETSLVNDI